ncbi:MAG: 3-oxoadipate enol-lactonase [Pseudomonadota bacterium]
MIETFSQDGIVIAYRDQAAAASARSHPALVFANSLGTDHRIWDPLMAVLARGPLADRRMLHYDKRGHGLTDGGPAAWQIDDLVADLAALMAARGIADAVVVGLSVGGLIAQGLAAARPDLVRGVVLCDTAAKIGTDAMWDGRIEAVESGGMAAIVDATMERWFTAPFRADPARLTPWRTMMLRCDPAGYSATARAIRDADYRERAAALSLPALAVVGEADGSTPPEMVEQTARLIPGCGFEVIAGAGHIPCVEQPEALAALIEGFVTTL